MGDLITICIPTYRRPSLLLHCLHTCFLQDYRPLEIDISDNSPTDDTRELVESLTVPQGISIRYWRNLPPTGPVENHQKLFASARGRRFVWMNDDDALLPGAISAMSNGFSLAPDVIVAYGHEQIINTAGEVMPEETARSNIEYQRLGGWGLRRDFLVSAFWQQISHVGFLVLTEAARKVGIRAQSEAGLAVDVDFSIRLALAYKGSAHVFLDRATVQTRIGPLTLNHTSNDVAWKLYDFVRGMDGLSQPEVHARDLLLKRIQPLALREHAIAHGRLTALRIFFSRPYRSSGGFARWAYTLGLIAAPHLAFSMRQLAKGRVKQERRPPRTRLQARVADNPSAGDVLPVPDHP